MWWFLWRTGGDLSGLLSDLRWQSLKEVLAECPFLDGRPKGKDPRWEAGVGDLMGWYGLLWGGLNTPVLNTRRIEIMKTLCLYWDPTAKKDLSHSRNASCLCLVQGLWHAAFGATCSEAESILFLLSYSSRTPFPFFSLYDPLSPISAACMCMSIRSFIGTLL